MPSIDVVLGDITTVAVDALVNAANRRMRGGGGVDGAIHRAGGPAILADCVARFPDGLATGDAGWTTAGNLSARWVIHTAGPNYTAGQRDRSLLTSCYRRALEVADELGARSVAFPLISAGIYGWPKRDAIAAAVETIASTATMVETVQLVVLDQETYEEVGAELAFWTPLRILQGVRVLHQRGYHATRILPGMSGSGMYWRVSIAAAANFRDDNGYLELRDWDSAVNYTTGSGTEFAGSRVDAGTGPGVVADLILSALPRLPAAVDDPAHAEWYANLMRLVEEHHSLPIAYADDFDEKPGWEIGWGSGIRHPGPPAPPTTLVSAAADATWRPDIMLSEGAPDLSAFSESGLFALYGAILRELKSRGVIRTGNAPVGDYAEYLVASAVGGQLAPNSEKAWDVLGSDGEKLQVKARVVSDPAEPGQLQLSPFRSFGFDSAVIVLLSATDYTVSRASKVPRHVVESSAVYKQHVNGKVLFARPEIMGHADATDLTAALRAIQTGREKA